MPMYTGVGGVQKPLSKVVTGVGGVQKPLDIYTGIGGVRKRLIPSAYYTVTYTVNSSSYGSISGSTSQTVGNGDSCTTVTAVANSGYHFVQWSDGKTSASRTDTNILASATYTAQFAADVVYYTLSYSTDGNGYINGSSSQSVASGGSGSAVTAYPYSGYVFSRWSDNNYNQTRQDTNVTSNKSVYAIFVPVYYTVNYSASTGGYISGSQSQSVAYGGSCSSVTANAYGGYYFDHWSDGVTTASRQDTNITTNYDLVAYFTPAGCSCDGECGDCCDDECGESDHC